MEQDRQTVSRKYRMTRFVPMRNMVVETVEIVFSKDKVKHLVFKGGTSLRIDRI